MRWWLYSFLLLIPVLLVLTAWAWLCVTYPPVLVGFKLAFIVVGTLVLIRISAFGNKP